MRVVVAGGTGFVGKSLVARLAGAGHEVLVLSRGAGSAERSLGGKVRVVAWSLASGPLRAEWEREVRAATAVVNLAGAGIMDRAWTDARMRELVSSRVDVTRALAEAMAGAKASAEEPRVLVSASAIGIYGARKTDEMLGEDTPPGEGFLADLCVAWEAAAAPARDAGARVVHPRLGIVLGKDGGALQELARPFKLGVGGPIGSGTQWESWIHERDVVLALERALGSGLFHGAYNFVAPHPVTMNDEAEALAQVLGTRSRVRVPAIVLQAVLGRGRAETVLTGQRVSSARLVKAGYAFAFEDIRPALQDLLGSR
jgi:uncharacterized protein (TIGR01777 family)